MNYTLEQCLEQQKKVDAGIRHNGEYNPKYAANAELVEMMDHLGLIKTWAGKPQVDEKQAFMELVDIFAFCMSWFNQREYKFLPPYEALEAGNGIDGLMYAIGDEKPECTFEWIATIANKVFVRPLQDVFYYYMGKQALTQFRQANGYKTGDYVKIWAGLEDNEHLTGMLEKGVSIADLPAALEQTYNSAVKHA